MIPKKIVAIGASSCEGKVDIEGGGFVGRLRRWHESMSEHNSVYNLGISGDTTEKVLKRISLEIPPRKPDLIIIQCGLNDFIHVGSKDAPYRFTLEQTRTNIMSMISESRKMADVLLVSVFPIDESKTCPCSWRDIYYLERDAQQSAELTKKISVEMAVPYIDAYDAFIKDDYKHYLFTDGLHPNSIGHEKIFQLIRSRLIELYQ